jgi:hypothetical protein
MHGRILEGRDRNGVPASVGEYHRISMCRTRIQYRARIFYFSHGKGGKDGSLRLAPCLVALVRSTRTISEA